MRAVLLTGGAGGMGSVMVQALLADGHSVVAVDRDVAALEQLRGQHAAAAAEGRLRTIPADIADESNCARAVDEAAAVLGGLHVLVNNAGIGTSSLRRTSARYQPGVEDLTAALWDGFFAVNVRAPFLLARACLPHLRRAGWGRIVNVTTSFMSMLSVQPYGPTKAALEAMSAVWAKEMAADGTAVNVLIPGGPTDTPFVGDASIPRDKMLRPTIMGPPIRWLVSDASNGFTGKRLVAARWDGALPPTEAAARCSRAIGWPELAGDFVKPGG